MQLSKDYYGKILIHASCDTVNNILTNYKIVFAKLKSVTNTNDSIEIRLDKYSENFKFIENNKDKIFRHISDIKIEKTGYMNCKIPTFTISIKVIND